MVDTTILAHPRRTFDELSCSSAVLFTCTLKCSCCGYHKNRYDMKNNGMRRLNKPGEVEDEYSLRSKPSCIRFAIVMTSLEDIAFINNTVQQAEFILAE